MPRQRTTHKENNSSPLKIFGVLFISIIFLNILDMITFWMTIFYTGILAVIAIIYLILSDGNNEIESKLWTLLGFLIGVALIIIPFPLTDPTGIIIMAYTAYKAGWAPDSITKK